MRREREVRRSKEVERENRELREGIEEMRRVIEGLKGGMSEAKTGTKREREEGGKGRVLRGFTPISSTR